MKFRLFDVDIYVSCLFTAVVAFLLVTDRTGLILPTFGAMLLHEIGHLIAMRALGCQPKQVRLIPAAVQIVGGVPKKTADEVLIALSGPLANLLVFALLLPVGLLLHDRRVMSWSLLNLLIALFQLLPVRGLDGGTLLFEALAARLPLARADLVLRLTTLALGAVASAVGVTLCFSSRGNPTLLLLGIYLLVASLLKI